MSRSLSFFVRRLWPRGLTLIEVVLSIVAIGIAVQVLLTLYAYVSRPHYQSEVIARATQLGYALLEEIQSRRFDEKLQKDGLGFWSSILGPDPYPSADPPPPENRSQFDDVDDYHGLQETLAVGNTQFTRSVQVRYIASPEPGPSGGGPPGIVWLPRRWRDSGLAWAAATTGDPSSSYKEITVTVSGPAGISIQLLGLATPANSQGFPSITPDP